MKLERPNIDQAELKGLRISAAGALVVGCIGILFSQITGSRAILLDGAFNLVYFVVSLLTMKVAHLVYRGDDIRFPVGYSFFEPLINGIKGVLILGISSMALLDAVSALFSGGRIIDPGAASLYGVFAATVCSLVALLLKRQTRASTSPLLNADAASWVVNAAISGAVLATFIVITLIDRTSWRSIVPYVDPLLVILIGAITLGVPVRIARQALMALINRAPPTAVRDEVGACVERALTDLGREQTTVRVLQPGRARMVMVHVVLSPQLSLSVEEMDAYRNKIFEHLQRIHPMTILDVVFTKDPAWGAPLAGEKDPGVARSEAELGTPG